MQLDPYQPAESRAVHFPRGRGIAEVRSIAAPAGGNWELELRWSADSLACSLNGNLWLRVGAEQPPGYPAVWLDNRADTALERVWLQGR